MKTVFAAAMLVLAASGLARPQPAVAGDWTGVLSPGGGASLRLVLHITAGADGALHATLDSVDQGARGIPVTSIALTGTALTLTLNAVGGSYEGTLNGDASVIDGRWTQRGTLPLVFTRVAAGSEVAAPKRPQDPVKPYPYRDEDVRYDNRSAHITLAATLTIPPGPGPFPAVLLITGSGPQDRDEALLGHRPFLVLADYLTRRGIAVLRADDRGVGQSGGTFAAATTGDFATDAEAGVAYLRSRRDVDPKKIGLIGHSEGGTIAPMIAARDHDIAFIVLMAGPGVPGDAILAEQNALIAEAMGASHEQAVARGAQIRAMSAIVTGEKDPVARESRLRALLTGAVPAAQIDAQINALDTPWFRYFLDYDPAPALRRVTCPVLAINGEKDLQVPPKQNLPAIRTALETSGNHRVEIVELPGLNHLFQTAKTGSPSEYADIQETIAPAALERIAAWIAKQ
jgi:uncharacterized protein